MSCDTINLQRMLHYLTTSIKDSCVKCFMKWMTTLLFSLLFWESVIPLLTSEGTLYTLPRADPLMLWLAIQSHALSPKGWKSLGLPFQPQLQLGVIMNRLPPRLLERKPTGGFWERLLGKHEGCHAFPYFLTGAHINVHSWSVTSTLS